MLNGEIILYVDSTYWDTPFEILTLLVENSGKVFLREVYLTWTVTLYIFYIKPLHPVW